MDGGLGCAGEYRSHIHQAERHSGPARDHEARGRRREGVQRLGTRPLPVVTLSTTTTGTIAVAPTSSGRIRSASRTLPAASTQATRREWQDAVMAFDELDERIVVALVDNARATYAEIGSSVGLSAPAVKRRVDRLRASGAITGFSARVDPSAMGWTTEAYVELFCRGRTSPAGIAAAVGKYPEVIAAATITGEADALLHIRAADVRHFERVVERIGAEPFVVRTRSVIVLSRLVDRPDVLPPSAPG
jgi:DNA-binding Lrp family transcriptional regulator